MVEQLDSSDEEDVRSASEEDLARIWKEWVARFGPTEASRRWLKIFAATDAPRTG